MGYRHLKTCRCGHTNCRIVSRRVAAFENLQGELLGRACPKCGAVDFTSASMEMVRIDLPLLLEWGLREDYYFIQQDEEIILADADYLEAIVEVLDHETVLPEKRMILLSALCVLLYDTLETEDDSLIQRVAKELKLRENEITGGGNYYLSDYITERIFPFLGFTG